MGNRKNLCGRNAPILNLKIIQTEMPGKKGIHGREIFYRLILLESSQKNEKQISRALTFYYIQAPILFHQVQVVYLT